MKRLLIVKLFAVLSLGLALFFGAGHIFVAAITMHGVIDPKMPASQCQSSCIPQSSTILTSKTSKKSETELDRDLDPQPAEPFYVTFVGVGWITAAIISTTYLMRYLRWRPPDLFMLNVNYQF